MIANQQLSPAHVGMYVLSVGVKGGFHYILAKDYILLAFGNWTMFILDPSDGNKSPCSESKCIV